MAFDPNFAVYRQQKTEILLFAGRVDGYPNEEHQLTLGTTENPVESGSMLTDNAVKRRDRLRLEGWVSDLLPAPGLTASPDRATDVWGEIIQIFKNRTVLEVVTPLHLYKNMMIVRAIAPRNKRTGRALRFTIDLREMLFSETSLARFPPDAVDPNGPAANRTSEVDRGDLPAPTVAITQATVL